MEQESHELWQALTPEELEGDKESVELPDAKLGEEFQALLKDDFWRVDNSALIGMMKRREEEVQANYQQLLKIEEQLNLPEISQGEITALVENAKKCVKEIQYVAGQFLAVDHIGGDDKENIRKNLKYQGLLDEVFKKAERIQQKLNASGVVAEDKSSPLQKSYLGMTRESLRGIRHNYIFNHAPTVESLRESLASEWRELEEALEVLQAKPDITSEDIRQFERQAQSYAEWALVLGEYAAHPVWRPDDDESILTMPRNREIYLDDEEYEKARRNGAGSDSALKSKEHTGYCRLVGEIIGNAKKMQRELDLLKQPKGVKASGALDVPAKKSPSHYLGIVAKEMEGLTRKYNRIGVQLQNADARVKRAVRKLDPVSMPGSFPSGSRVRFSFGDGASGGDPVMASPRREQKSRGSADHLSGSETPRRPANEELSGRVVKKAKRGGALFSLPAIDEDEAPSSRAATPLQVEDSVVLAVPDVSVEGDNSEQGWLMQS